MSLNGLEAADVNEAYQSALVEGGGWLLLNYASRDEVSLLQRGNGGLTEVQEAVNRYKESSPLFGFIHYRRRKVLLKYVPEGTSRMLQARVSVHFQSVADKFTPHDSIFSFTKPEELHDAALSSALSLHTAAPLLKTSNDSISQGGLAGITEDVSETRVDNAAEKGSVEETHRTSLLRQKSGDSQTRPELTSTNPDAKHAHERKSSITTQQSVKRSRAVSNVDKALPPTPGDSKYERVAIERHPNDKTVARSILDHSDYETRPSVEERLSSQSARPSARDLYDAYGYKQKVKLGPRPSTESGGRSDHMERANDFRPVSTLPAGLRMPTRKGPPQKITPTRPQSQHGQRVYPGSYSQRETPPAAPMTPIQIPDRKVPIIKNGLLTPAKTPGEASSPKITPEKRRLMKALQLRQKQLAAQKPTNGFGNDVMSSDGRSGKADINELALNGMTNTFEGVMKPDLVHVIIGSPVKDESRNVEASPVSIVETSDGPSTQASSITDEEDDSIQNKDTDAIKDIEMSRAGDNAQSVSANEYTLGRTLRGEEKETHPTDDHVDQTSSAGAGDEQRVPVDRPEEAGHPSTVVSKALSRSTDRQDDVPCSLIVADASVTAKSSPPATQKDSSIEFSEKFQGTSSLPVSSPTIVDIPAINEIQNATQSDVGATEQLDIPIADHKKEQLISPEPHSQISDPGFDPRMPNSGVVLSRENDGMPNRLDPVFNRATDHVNPLEVPLPPIDEDEEICLSSQRSQASSSLQSSTARLDATPGLSQAQNWSQNNGLMATRLSTSDSTGEQQSERQVRRRGVVNPPNRLSSPEHSDEQFLSDDSFMEELKSATLHEAKPISVSKSPIKPVFSRSDSDQRWVETTQSARSVSSPLNEQRKDEEVFSIPQLPTPPKTRSFSANPTLQPESQKSSASLPKKVGVSTGISQRIKALEQLSSRPTSPQSVAPPNTSVFITQRKSSFRSPPRATDSTSVPNSQSRPNITYPSPSPSPEIVKSNPFNNVTKTIYARPESVSVTATIIRDARDKTPRAPLNPSEPHKLDLHQSPLTVEHQKMMPPPLSPLKPPRPRYARYASARSGSSSSTEQKLESPQTTRRDSFASILSRSSRAGSEAELPRSLSDPSLNGITSRDVNSEEKKDSRRSRLMKRMSSISSMSRRSIANALSPSPKEAPIFERQESVVEIPSALVDVGDINVQFPDTLLWKRRHMVIDEQGILVLSASISDSNSKVITKRYPISEFQAPYIPDQDRQELPNSVILDFKDGSTLQCACEHPQGQARVLQILREAHSHHQS